MVFSCVAIVSCKVSICRFWTSTVVWHFDNSVFKASTLSSRLLFWFWRVSILCVFKMDSSLYLLASFWFCNTSRCNLEIVSLAFLSSSRRSSSCCLKDSLCLTTVWTCISYLLIVKFPVFPAISDCLRYLSQSACNWVNFDCSVNSSLCSMSLSSVAFLHSTSSWEIVSCRKDASMSGDDSRTCTWDTWLTIWSRIIASSFSITTFSLRNFSMAPVLLLSSRRWDSNSHSFSRSLRCIEDSSSCCLLYFDLKSSNCSWSWWFCRLRFSNFVFHRSVCKQVK